MHPLEEKVVGQSAHSTTENAIDVVEVVSETKFVNVAIEPPIGLVPPPVVVDSSRNEIVPPPLPVVPPPLPLVVISDPTTATKKKNLGPREWIVERWRETPCWLSSLVLHLLVMVVLGSLVLPVGMTVREKILTFVFVDTPNETEIDFLEPLQAVPSSSFTTTPSTVDTATDSTPKLEVAVQPPPNTSAPKPEPPPAPPAAATVGSAPKVVTAQPAGIGPRMARTDPLPGPLTSTEIIPGTTPSLNQPDEVDEIVDRFIEFDIGQLQGEAGARARRRFEALNYKDIPALVRGLNKSAYIQASCPVMVIEAKLYGELRKSRDPNLVSYALDNLGRDIPADAPHVQRLVRLREQIRSEFVDRTRLRQDLARRGLPNTDSFMDKLEVEQKRSFPDFVQALKNTNREDRLAATVEAQGRSWSGVSPAQRMKIALSLMANLAENDGQIQRESHQALTALTTDNTTIPKPFFDDDVPTKIRLWRNYWDKFRQGMLDRQAESFLRLATNLDASNNVDGAMNYYRRIIDEFPSCPAAEKAQERLAELGGKTAGKRVRNGSPSNE